ncbi:MAG: hypothetical protein ACSHX0_12940 [Akkermansiaceae bacterium]
MNRLKNLTILLFIASALSILQAPEKFAELLASLKEDVESGRSTAGSASKNDTDEIILWKSGQPN